MSRHRIGLSQPLRLRQPLLTQSGGGWAHMFHGLGRHSTQEEVSDTDRPTVPQPIGDRGDEEASVVLTIDVSGSTEQTDPNGHRFVAARRIVNLLADGLGGPPLDDQIGVILFAEDAIPWLPLTPLRSRENRRKIRHVLRPTKGGGTAIVPALARTQAILRRAKGLPVVLLFTDGESAESSVELTKAVRRLPAGAVHVVVLGSVLPEQWVSVPVGSITTMESFGRSADAVEWLLAQALYRSLGLGWHGPTEPHMLERGER